MNERKMNEEKKAAILTWCYNNGKTNYGQILQCYAMQQMVRKMGYNPIIVRYRKLDIDEDYASLIGADRESYEYDYRIKVVEGGTSKRIDNFVEFIKKNIHVSGQCYTVEEIERETENCELLVCGSDQIWNPLWFDEVYVLNFGSSKQKRIAYAPSGVLDETRSESVKTYKRIAELIDRFDYVSVREKKGVAILRKFTQKRIEEALDPTLLMEKSEWDVIAANRVIEGRYLFCYCLGRLRSNKILLHHLAKKYNAERVAFITSGHYEGEEELESGGMYQSVGDAGPAEFISLIKHSVAVCTDSFHGIALSIVYNKQFYIINRNDPDIELWGSMERQKNLLEKVGIKEGRLVHCVSDIEHMKDIDYSEIDVNRSLPLF